MKKAILIGASSGIGRELAKVLVREGYVVGIAARRVPLLQELQQELGDRALVKRMDVADVPRAMDDLSTWLKELGYVELVVLTAGLGHTNPDLRGTLRPVEDAPWLHALVARLTQTHEQGRAHPWSVTDAIV